MVKIFIDAGHGGQDSGAVGNGLKEKNIALSIAQEVKRILSNEYNGVEVKMSREGDTFPTLGQRTTMANNWGADLFLSIHCNSGGGFGYEDFIYVKSDSKTISLQNVMHENIYNFYKPHGARDRGKKKADYHVLRESSMIAILTENLFMDNIEITKFNDTNFLNGVARAHANGVAEFFKLNKKVLSPTPSPSGNVGKLVVVKYDGTDGLNIRQKPDFSSKVVAVVHKGEAFRILEELKDHYRIGSGYITKSKSYVLVR